jgi:hypothetical protein
MNKKLFQVCVVVTFSMFLIYWFVDYFASDKNSVKLRTLSTYEDGVLMVGSDVKTWHLRIPKQIYLIRSGSVTGAAYDDRRIRDPGTTYSFNNAGWTTVFALSNIEGSAPISGKDLRIGEVFNVELDNKALRLPRLVKSNYCLSVDEIVADKPGHPGQIPCTPPPGGVNCSVVMNYHGWNAIVSVSRQALYKEPRRVCELLRSTLDAWTVSIDDTRNSK